MRGQRGALWCAKEKGQFRGPVLPAEAREQALSGMLVRATKDAIQVTHLGNRVRVVFAGNTMTFGL